MSQRRPIIRSTTTSGRNRARGLSGPLVCAASTLTACPTELLPVGPQAPERPSDYHAITRIAIRPDHHAGPYRSPPIAAAYSARKWAEP